MFNNKRGAIGILIFFAALMLVLVVGFIAAISWSVFDIASDEITPIMEDLGVVGDVNMSEVAGYTFGVVDGFVQALPWIVAFGYIMALVFTLVFVFLSGYNPHPAYFAFYISLMLLMVFGCIIMSNMYQDIHTGTDDVATRLQEQTIMSYMILHSPWIMCFIAVIGGVLMFGMKNNEFGGGV